MAGDDLMNFPTPAEAFGRGQANNQRRASPSQSSQSSVYSRHTPTTSNSRPYQNGTPTRLPPPQQPSAYGQPVRPQQPAYGQRQAHNVPPPQQQQQQPQQQGQRVTSRNGSLGMIDSSGSNQGSFMPQQAHQPQQPHQQQGYPQQSYYQQTTPITHALPQQSQPSQPHQTIQPPKPIEQSQPQPSAAQVLERQLRDIFDRSDRDRDGKLTEEELGSALLNNDGSQFNASTLKLMIRLFDTDDSSTIEFKEFYDLWTYILHWRRAFQRYDTNQNGKISFGEYQTALESFGYRLPTDIVLFVFQKFGDFNSNRPMSLRFDMFVESLIWLLRCTNIFKKFDSQGNGIATIPFQDFVHEFISFI